MATISSLRKHYEQRIALGAGSGFQKELLAAAFDNLEVDGPLRFNNFAYALREFLRHMLHDAAPTEEVKSCEWFKPEKGSKTGITRLHRAKYAIQGGLSDKFLEKKLDIETEETLKDLLAAQNTLSKYTHIEPGTFDVSKKETATLAGECLEAAAAYVEIIFDCRRLVRDAVLAHVDQHLIDEIVTNGIDELGEIATHGWTEGHCINELMVEKISSKSILLLVEGDIDVGLQYGSNGDVKRDMGLVTSDSFPFEASVNVAIKAPLGKYANVERLDVNTDSFYE